MINPSIGSHLTLCIMITEMKNVLKDFRECVKTYHTTTYRNGFLIFKNGKYSVDFTIIKSNQKSKKEYKIGDIWVFVMMKLRRAGRNDAAQLESIKEVVFKHDLRPIKCEKDQGTKR